MPRPGRSGVSDAMRRFGPIVGGRADVKDDGTDDLSSKVGSRDPAASVMRVVPIEELRPPPYSVRRQLGPRSAAYRRLRESLEQFGLVLPLVWNESSGHVIDGSLRLRLLREGNVRAVAVSAVCLSPAAEKALHVLLNNPEVQSRFDRLRLRRLLEELAGSGALPLTGFGHAVLRELEYVPAVLPGKQDKSAPVEVGFVVAAEQWEALRPRLDELVRQFDLRVHVRAASPG